MPHTNDTQRLDWLERNLNTIRLRRQKNGTLQLALNPSINYEYDVFQSFREAIDAAMGKEATGAEATSAAAATVGQRLAEMLLKHFAMLINRPDDFGSMPTARTVKDRVAWLIDKELSARTPAEKEAHDA